MLIVSQFVRPDGCLLPRRVTGLCIRAHDRMKIMVHKAQVAGEHIRLSQVEVW